MTPHLTVNGNAANFPRFGGNNPLNKKRRDNKKSMI